MSINRILVKYSTSCIIKSTVSVRKNEVDLYQLSKSDGQERLIAK